MLAFMAEKLRGRGKPLSEGKAGSFGDEIGQELKSQTWRHHSCVLAILFWISLLAAELPACKGCPLCPGVRVSLPGCPRNPADLALALVLHVLASLITYIWSLSWKKKSLGKLHYNNLSPPWLTIEKKSVVMQQSSVKNGPWRELSNHRQKPGVIRYSEFDLASIHLWQMFPHSSTIRD